MNDAGTFFADRMTAHPNGDTAKVTWTDDYGPNGTTQDLDLIRAAGQWRIFLKSFTHGDHPESARDVIEGIGETNAFTRDLERVEARIKSGELATFDAIHRAP
jgi:hypothetical protein